MNTDNTIIRSAATAERKKMRAERFALLRRNPAFFVGSVLLAIWIFAALVGEFLVPIKPEELDFMATDMGPSSAHWFGTDTLGRDVFSRVIVGSRPIIVMAFCATILGTVVGTTIGLLTGYFKGKLDLIVMRILDAISALSVLVLALLAIVADGGLFVTVSILIIVVLPDPLGPMIA